MHPAAFGAIALEASKASENTVKLDIPAMAWAAVVAFIVVLLIADILLLHREAHEISLKEAAIESAAWVSIGLSFGVVMWIWHGATAAGEYYSGYLIEQSLSIDNVFVWALILSHFAVPKQYQFRVLFWGVFGALVLRAVFVFTGVAIIERFEWVLYIFGAFLIYTAIKLALSDDDDDMDPEASLVLRVVRRVVPSTNTYDGQRLFTRVDGRRLATPLFAVLVLIEATDVIFAVDSVPAVLAVSRDQFIVFTSNAFAILGLRSMYFLVADMHGRFDRLQEGLAIILAFVGVKMLIAHWYHIPTAASLTFIAVVLAVSILMSLRSSAVEEPPIG
jgi:tellurite resistance protein TerC